MAKLYDLHSDEELNWDFGTADHDNDSGSNNKCNISRAKGWPVENNKKNKISSPTVKGKFLKVTTARKPTKKTNIREWIPAIIKKED